MLQQDIADDFLISTGESHSLEEFISCSFRFFNLDWRDYVTFNNQFNRPTDIYRSSGNPSKAREKLNWTATKRFDEMIRSMCEAAIEDV
jgi:GDPmannose 4,6-dehydratase